MEKLLSTTEAAKELGITVARVQTLIWDERLPAFKVGRAYAIKQSDLELVRERIPGRPPKSKTKRKVVKDANSVSESEIVTRIDVDKKLVADTISPSPKPLKSPPEPNRNVWFDSDGETAEMSENQSGKGRRRKRK